MQGERQVHTIFGAGQVGSGLAHELLRRGHQVRLVRRGAPGASAANLQWMQGDVLDDEFADAAANGADVVYNCMNPQRYYEWAERLPPLFEAARRAATRAQARLVVLDCAYMYGPSHQAHMHEGVEMAPQSDKGKLRRELAERLFDAHARGELRATSGRASDYFGPQAVNSLLSNPRALQRISQGKAIEVFGDPDARHSFTFVPDVVRGLATLGEAPSADGRAWHLPSAWHGTTRAFIEGLAAQWEQATVLRRVPKWVVRAGGLVSPTMRAMVEMLYQWESDFVLDDRAFREHFGIEATPSELAFELTAASLEAPARAA